LGYLSDASFCSRDFKRRVGAGRSLWLSDCKEPLVLSESSS
jgi:hypothetical protein